MAMGGFNQNNHHRPNEEYEYDDADEFYDDNTNAYSRQNNHDVDDSEDTEEASESEYGRGGRSNNEPLEIKELMYQDKLASLMNQLNQLKNDQHPEYLRRFRKLEHQFKERLRVNEVHRDFAIECIDREFLSEKKAAIKEFDEKRCDLQENLMADAEEKRKHVENERHTMELTNDSTETKPTVTRKLRRRPNEPVPQNATEKRRKPTVSQLVLLLDDKDIEADLKLINRGKALGPIRSPSHSNGLSSLAASMNIISSLPPTESYAQIEAKVEDGKLLFERRWFHRGQPVFVEGKEVVKFPAVISSISNEVISVKKVNDTNKIKIPLSHLTSGKISIKRRAN